MQSQDDIAVVGIAYKLPQNVEDDAGFCEVLQNAKNLSSKWPEERMKSEAHPDPRNGNSHSQGGHFITDDPAGFDAPLFSITAKEAASMDPVQRWTLEVSYRAFENAGIPYESLKGSRTAVLSATFTEDYIRMAAMDPDNVERTAATGCLASVIPNRVSYFFGMHGPSIHVDTACSSGLTAFDMACKVLKTGDADAALVTAANLILEPGMFQMFRNLQMLSPDNTCKAFDHKANGFGRGEGVLAFVLKPLSSALRDGDMIRAVVRGVASNQDGHTPALSQPNPVAQEQLIRHVYAQAGLEMTKTRYVEAHGTGTPVGDPIEMKAIGSAFRDCRSAEEPLYVGSVKSNLGHLEGASGLAGILKAILILEKGVIPPNALFEKLNTSIDADFLRVEVLGKCIPWPSTGLRRVSINGFGFGGSNTHVVLDDALHFLKERGLAGHHCTVAGPAASTNGTVDKNSGNNGFKNGIHGECNANGTDNTHATNGVSDATSFPAHNSTKHPKLLVFSGFDEKATKRTIEGYSTWFGSRKVSSNAEQLNSLASTLATRRSHMRWRSFAIAKPSRDLLGESVPLDLSSYKPVRVISEPGLAWVFTGQGAQYVDMGWELVKVYPIFKETLEKVSEIYQGFGCSWSILDELRRRENINKPEYSQPLSTAIQIALVELLKSFGITPKAVVGHSSGEIAAAYAIGALSLISACKVSYYRGLVAGKLRLANASSPGSMISINLTPDQVTPFLSKIEAQLTHVGIACINSPLNVTLSGPEAGIDAVKEQADREGIFAQKLKTGVAYHSLFMHTISKEYLELMGDLKPTEIVPIPMLSTVTGKMINPRDLATGQYWVDNMISPVKFAAAVKLMASESLNLGLTDLIEIGPHPVLRRYVHDSLGEDMQYLSVLYRGESAIQKTLELTGTLFCRGHDLALEGINQQERGRTMPFLVDCPPYPFDHSHKFWAESRISKDYRLREPTKGAALGQRAADWNPLEPRWRSFLSVETHPWIGHHVVDSTVLFPAAGMLIMAFEAALEMVPVGKTVAGYFVKEAHFKSPVVVPEHWDDRVEMMVSLRPIKNHHLDAESPARSEIGIFSYAKDSHSWTEVFRTSIQVQYATTGEGPEKQMAHEVVRTQHQQILRASTLPVDSHLFYSDAAEYGLQYGEHFKLCQDIRWDKAKGQAIASVQVSRSGRFQTASVMNAAVLDTAFHVLRVSAGQQHATNVPARLENAWFAASGWQPPKTEVIRWMASSRNTREATRGEQGSVSALAEDGTVLATIQNLTTATISGDDGLGEIEKKKLLYGIEWKPQLSLLDPEQLSHACKAGTFPREESIMLSEHRERTAVLNIVAVRHVGSIPDEQRTDLNSTLRHHMDWMEHHVRLLPLTEREAAEALTNDEFEAKLDSFAAAFPSWTLYPHVSRCLPAIVAGDMDPLEVIFESDHAKTFYSSLFHTVCGDGRLSKFIDLAAHENPPLRILEVGAGTGGMTVHIINALKEREKRTGAIACAEYMYTDISPVFFESAKERWDAEGFGGRMSFKTLNMEHSVSDEGFEENEYDLLIAGSCIHATGLLSNTLQNLRRLLKPGGKLVTLEVTDPTDIATCFFATLASGWWLSQEEWRIKNKSPLASEDAWHVVLRENGFSGNDLVLRDTREEEAHIVSVIVSTAIETGEKKPESSLKLFFVVGSEKSKQTELANSLCKGEDVVLPLDQILSTSIGRDDIVICLAEVYKPLLATISKEHFAQLQALFKQARNVLWVTAPENGVGDIHFSHYAIAKGFLRTIRAELPDSHIVSLSIEDRSSLEVLAKFITTTLETACESSPASELDYIVRSGQIHTARAIENVSANSTIRSLLFPKMQQLAWRDGPAVRLAFGTPGSLDSLRFEHDEKHGTALDAYEVEIEAQAWGISRRDVVSALGHRGHDPENLSTECAGVVTRVGSSHNQGLKPGDCVFMLAQDCMRKFPRAHQDRVVKIDITCEMAAAGLGPLCTAYHALLEIARLTEGDKVLIHEASGAVGEMAVKIAKMKGAEVFATTSASTDDEEQKQRRFLIDDLGLASDHVFSACNNSTYFATGIKRVTKGYGVDVVLNTLTGDQLQASWELLAPCGRLVDVGLGERNTLPLGGPRNASSATVDIVNMPPRLMARLFEKAMDLLSEITLPAPVLVLPATDIKEASKRLQNEQSADRVVVTPKPDDDVAQFVFERQPLKLSANASYLVTGGLGGVGRSILKWLVIRGARHLIVPSRSGVSSVAAEELLSSLRSSGVNILAPRCNIANEDELAALLQDSKKTMPAIRGVINCAMVLTNAVFANMAFEQWSSAIEAKVSTSFNLHRMLPDQEQMDFFVHLASLAGVNGQMASANYAAGCTFQDALARHYPGATALDVGWMADVGLIAETAAYQRQLKDWGNMQRVEERELLGVLDMVCDAENVDRREDKTGQLLVGLLTPADYISKGKTPPPALQNRPLLSTFSQPIPDNCAGGNTDSSVNAEKGVDYSALFRAATDDKIRAQIVVAALAEKLGRAMMMSADEVDPDRPLSAYGIDSLMAVELRNWMVREFGVQLAIWEMMGGETVIKGIAEIAVQKSCIKP